MQDDEAREQGEMAAKGLTRLWVQAGTMVHIRSVPFEVGDHGVYLWGTLKNAELLGLRK